MTLINLRLMRLQVRSGGAKHAAKEEEHRNEEADQIRVPALTAAVLITEIVPWVERGRFHRSFYIRVAFMAST